MREYAILDVESRVMDIKVLNFLYYRSRDCVSQQRDSMVIGGGAGAGSGGGTGGDEAVLCIYKFSYIA